MVKIREIPRTAAFAWSPGVTAPWVVTGTKAGAVDVDFSNETSLELWDLSLDDTTQSQDLQPKVTIPTEVGFHDLAWTAPTGEYKKGIIAGALDNGVLGLWDAEKLISDPANASIFHQKIHSGAIKCLQFNPKIPNFLASGGEKGELFISDLDNLGAPIRLGSTAARADDIDCLDWNKKVPNILVTGSSGGFVTVWDLKTKRESLTLNNYGRKAVSAVAWDPEKPTRLITAVPLEQEPVILVWDLRNSNAPEKILRGHDSGVLSLSWCPQDSDLLLSCGKDNRTILWNPQTGQAYGDYPVVTNWTFQTRWNPKNPSMFATASFDGKLSIQTLQNTNPSEAPQDQTQATDGEDFFSKAQTQPQTSSFSLLKAPKWLERPASISFGFGGRLISVKQVEPGKSRASKVTISKFEVDSSVGEATNSFEKAIESGNLNELCETRISEAKNEEEKSDWQVMETLLSANPRKELVKFIGFEDADEEVDSFAKLGLDDKSAEKGIEQGKTQVNGSGRGHRRFESVFATDADGDFLSQLAATQGTKTNNPFQLFTGSETEADKKITKAVMLGQFEKALDICLAEERMSDAFMLAICGGEKCIKKAQEAYFAKQSGGPNYLRLLASVVGKNLWDTVHNADLENWREVMATICTFADEKEFPELCEALGDRLEENIGVSASARKDAAFCYLAGSKLEKVVAIWIQELKEHEDAGVQMHADSSAFSLHAKALQDLVEKVTIFRRVVNFQDNELSKSSGWKLNALYSKYLEYADIVAAHGQLSAAQRYLDLLPVQYPEADVARSRIEQATKKPSAVQAKATTARAATAASPQKPLPGYQAPQSTFTPAGPQAATPAPYSTPQPAPFAANPYAPAQPQGTAQQSNPYAPTGYQAPQQMRSAPAPVSQQGYGVPPPPRVFNQSPAVPPPSQNKNVPNWNDIPDGFVKPPTPRRGTPSVAPPMQQFQTQPPAPGQGIPPPVQPPYGARRGSPAPPPPPKGSAAPPPRVTSPLAGMDSSSASSNNPYAPNPATQAPSISQNIMSPPIPRGSSPFTAPPSGAPPPNRYAPAPGSQPSQGPPQGRPTVAPPPQASQYQSAPPPVANAYAPNRSQAAPSPSPYAPQQSQPGLQQSAFPPPVAAPPPAVARPPSQPSAARPTTSDSQQQTTAAAARKHTKGDRTHIPSSAQPVFTILSNQMMQVKARAPASYKPQVDDTEKRLNILYDHLNNEDLIRPDTIQQLVELSQALEARDFARAGDIQMEVHRDKVEECGNWMVGVKRLVLMCKAMA